MKMIKFMLLSLALALPLAAENTIVLTSAAVVGKPEKGFDSQLLSAGRADAAFNGSKSLPFTWSNLPDGTKSLAVVYDDPDARLIMRSYGIAGDSWIHWLATDIDPSLGGFQAGDAIRKKSTNGLNSSGRAAYEGPEPPSNVPADAPRPIIHIYRLHVYALSSPTKLKTGFDLPALRSAIQGKVLGEGELLLSFSN